MRIFVTGASGFIGSAVVPELLGAGHQVIGLARSDASARAVEAMGASVQRGALDDLESLRAGAQASDGVIHLAFIHDFSNYEAAARADREAIAAMGEVLAGSNRPLVNASGLLGVAPGRVAVETDAPSSFGRGPAESQMLALAGRGVRTSVVRLPPIVHANGDGGFLHFLLPAARQHGVAGYPGEGANRWPAVHRSDAARLFRLAVEKAPAGSLLHAVGDEGVTTRAIAEAIGRKLGVPAVSKAPDELQAYFGFLATFIGLDAPSSATITRETLGWTPTGPGLIEDLATSAALGAR